MTSHAQCTHQASPEARRSCRMLRPVLACAAHHNLVVKQVGDDPKYPQYEIRTQRDRDWDTRMLITSGFNTPTVSLRQATGQWKSQPWKNITTWLFMMADDDKRGQLA